MREYEAQVDVRVWAAKQETGEWLVCLHSGRWVFCKAELFEAVFGQAGTPVATRRKKAPGRREGGRRGGGPSVLERIREVLGTEALRTPEIMQRLEKAGTAATRSSVYSTVSLAGKRGELRRDSEGRWSVP